jgi:hypothetical protein
MRKIFNLAALVLILGLIIGMNAMITPVANAQAGVSTGSIQGTILDPNGATVGGSKVTITSKGTGAKVTPEVTSAGTYNSGPLVPGEYVVRVEAPGFRAIEETLTVQVGNITPGTITLELGSGNTIITVEGSAVNVDTEQTTIQGVVTSDQIENLPINGRNFLDLAQLEPGVQIQDGGNFDPTKKGFSSISFGGRFGRTARIEVDGLDISDETVGTTTQNLGVNSIKEFQVSQSSLDISTELTSSGTVNITTNSGTNTVHGEGFFNYRSDGTSAAIGDPAAQFTRKQYGTNLGGALIKDKLFGFGSWERTTQDLIAAGAPQAPFNDLRTTFNAPFRDQEYLGRVDYTVTNNIHAFFKFAYEQNLNGATFIPGTYQEFSNVDFTPSYGGGFDITHGKWTHTFRLGYLKFRNGITDAVTGSNIFNPAPLLALAIGNVSTSCLTSGDLFCSGPNILAPQKTYQSNKQFKYDGTRSFNSHILRYGVGVNRILGGGFASFFGIAPAVRASVSAAHDAFANKDPFGPGGDTNPLNWPVHRIDVGNGEGCFTEIPQFGQTCGGQFDTRFQAYIGDTWKVRPNITFLYGLRYNRDTGRSDADLPAVQALNDFQAGLGNRVRQPNKNFGGTIGLAWDPRKNGKTVIRAGAGIYYENGVFNNVLFDRPGRLPTGLFNQVQEVCTNVDPVTKIAGGVLMPDGSFKSTIDGLSIPTQICGDQNAVGNVQTAISDLQKSYQQATIAAGAQANGAYFGNVNTTANTGSMFAPNFRSPYSAQMNVGFQRELHHGTVLSVDYIRNVGLHTLLGIDQNHQGDASTLNVANATAAISATNASFNDSLGNPCPAGSAGINCAIAAGALISDYANNGLTGGPNATGNFPVGQGTLAFEGKNPNFGQVLLLEPIGRSVYNGLDVVLRSDLKSPVSFIRRLNAQISYSLSRYNAQASDGDFVNSALDYNNPSKFIGPNGLDRTHQFSAGVVMELPAGIRANFITHFYTALPQTLTFFAPGNLEDIFQYDTNGDGQTGVAPVPGSKVGSYGRDISPGGLNSFLQTYSDKFGNQLTPAGQALVSAGLFTADQLKSLCAVTPSLNPIGNCGTSEGLQLPSAAPGQVGNGNFFTFDLRLGWSIKPIRKWERVRFEPQAAFYNLFNRKNYNGPDNLISGVLDGSSGSVATFLDPVTGQPTGGTYKSTRRPFETGLGSGVFAIGAPRSMEFGFKVNF